MEKRFLQLKDAREELGLSLHDVSQKLNIKKSYLESIEQEKFEELPEDVYAIGFIRGYAKFLKIDSDELVKIFKQKRALLNEEDEANKKQLSPQPRVIIPRKDEDRATKILIRSMKRFNKAIRGVYSTDKNMQLMIVIVILMILTLYTLSAW